VANITLSAMRINLAKLFGSQCRVKILEKFILEQSFQKKESVGFFIRELCRDIDEQINSVRRELLNLEQLRLLHSREQNKKKFYYLNRESPIYQEMADIFIKNYDCVEALKEFFKGKKGLDLVTVTQDIQNFVTDRSNNIVDIFIIGEVDKIDFNNFLAKTFFGKKIKYAVMTHEDFTKRLEYGDKLVLNILNQKGTLFLRDRLGIEEKLKD